MSTRFPVCSNDDCNSLDDEFGGPYECEREAPCRVPWHMRAHADGAAIESCCGCCNLFAGVVLTALAQSVGGLVLLILLASYSEEYDLMYGGIAARLVASACLAASMLCGAALMPLVLLDSLRLVVCYLVVALATLVAATSLGIYKTLRGCSKAVELGIGSISNTERMDADLACSLGLLTLALSFLYVHGFAVAFGFYHFRYVRRLVYEYEARCACRQQRRRAAGGARRQRSVHFSPARPAHAPRPPRPPAERRFAPLQRSSYSASASSSGSAPPSRLRSASGRTDSSF